MCQAWMGVFVAQQFPAFCTTWRVSELLENVLRIFSCSEALGVPQQAREVVHPDSALDVEQQAVHLSKLQTGPPRRALDRVQIIQRRLAFTALDLITRPPPFRATMCSCVWNRFPSHVPNCHLSVMPLMSQVAPSMLMSLHSFIRRCTITRHMAFVQNVRCMFNNPRNHRRVNGDGTPDTISSSDLIPRSRNPFDWESATGECSNNVPLEPRRPATPPKTPTIAGS